MLTASFRAASVILVPVTSLAVYATYVRSNAKPTQAHIEYMKNTGVSQTDYIKWIKLNNGLGLIDVGRSGGGL
ncbi:uncharacterized protein BX663DRAFT_443590 [Cokeromyces recurvatus]|uniref:uncharacterized protein n=1 Tax=Cokeromyces recurvatus TaxID=90255 RepID=UPI0022202B8D|nr:uncharacterized protein BX663DRAFT_443590 [Cokeromyces recurvatus]KAI7898186.1 hypothetical protein BX663DRAFT_443590 [Cokeromyces recurvatus]